MSRGAGGAGHGITIGLNQVDAAHYSTWPGILRAAEADADSFEQLLVRSGFAMQPALRRKKATRAAVTESIKRLAAAAAPGDLVCVYYAGHGGSVFDSSRDEMHGRDQTWCLYDGQLVDDEIYNLCTEFVANTRVVFVSDSCKSGSMLMEHMLRQTFASAALRPTELAAQFPIEFEEKSGRALTRSMPETVAFNTRMKNRSFYDKIISDAKARTARMQTRVELLAASSEMMDAYEDRQHGYFTGSLLKQCGPGCNLTYEALLDAIERDLRGRTLQTPTRFSIGVDANWYETDVAFRT